MDVRTDPKKEKLLWPWGGLRKYTTASFEFNKHQDNYVQTTIEDFPKAEASRSHGRNIFMLRAKEVEWDGSRDGKGNS